jgi:hypothetical protein
MKKSQWLWWVNLLLFVALTVQITTVVLRDELPFKTFALFHFWCGRLLLTLAVVHLILNWGWMKTNVLRFLKGPQAN